VNGVWITGVALMMVSTIPTASLKRIRIPHHLVIPTLLGIGVATAFLTTAPWPTLTVVGAIYLGSIPLTIRAAHRQRRAFEAGQGHPAALAPALPAAATLPVGAAGTPASAWRH
ncbi:MAG TPA: CDP-diacylglycerol O-phosphatidyltransferase, partial [Stellaceae bacterium]|nr:CDP-diacylglycerol O-phosphatidyltransferase [Stellaceae bacterium]